jgi:hypothetical protein
MELKGSYKLSYTLDREPKDLILSIELKMIDGLMKPYQNVWEGKAMLNGQPYEGDDLSHCVNAKTAAERIGKRMKLEIKEKAQKEGHTFRVKKEEAK